MKPDKVRNGRNRLYTKSLFADVPSSHIDGLQDEEAPYWLSECDIEGDKRPVFKDEFLRLRDATGVKLAHKYLASFEHLQRLLECHWFKSQWDLWVKELYAILKQEALERIEEISKEGSAQSLSAAKYIADMVSGESATPKKRGRPSSEEVSGELKNQVRQLTKAEEDYNRLTQWNVIKGGKKG